MRTFVLVIIFSYTVVLFYLVLISKTFTLSTLKVSLMTYVMLNIGALTSFMNILCITKSKCAYSFLGWVSLLIFSIYIYKYVSTEYSFYYWFIFAILWLILGSFNPVMNA